MGSGVTFNSRISLFFASSSVLAGSAGSTSFSSAASASFLASGSEEYHRDDACLNIGAKERFDCRNWGRFREDRGTVRILEDNAHVFRRIVLGIMVEEYEGACEVV